MACLFLFENPVDFFKVMLIVYRCPYSVSTMTTLALAR